MFTTRSLIKARTRRRWLLLSPPERLERPFPDAVPDEVSEAVQCTYEILERMPVNEHIIFALRHVEGMKLNEIAEACDVSVATVKRRLGSAQRRFLRAARQRPILRSWLEGNKRWTKLT